MAKKRWFQVVIARRYGSGKGKTGWSKNKSATARRRAMLRAHNGNYLAAARALIALANVTKDTETRQKARADAKYFLKKYRTRRGR